MIDETSFEMPDDKVIEKDNTKPFATNFLNAEADITEINGKYVVQIFSQADIDSFVCRQYTFDKEPSKNDVSSAYDLSDLKMALYRGIKIKEYRNDIFWADDPAIIKFVYEEYNIDLQQYK